ncbi:MAG: hypothetical protein IJX17_07995 [Clostridia bacterium]|nr:hypothetical protein [Clostridia bacterium]
MAIKYSSYSMIKRLLALLVLVIFFMFIIIFRLFYIQVIGGYSFVREGLTEWLRDLPLIATRGTITDRNGVVLASSYTTYDVYVRPADVDDCEGLAQILSSVLNLDYEKVYEKVTKKGMSEIKIATDIEKNVVQELLKGYKSGMFFTSDTMRNYNYDNMLCQILGFVGVDNDGQTGIESFYNTYLSGQNGVSLVEADLKGSTLHNSLTYYEDAINGLNLSLTIDFRIQKIVEETLANAMVNTGAKSISCLVTNPKNGEILSVCTLPSYNLNDIPRDDLLALNSLSRATTIVDTFEPGSTFKAIVAAIALEEGLTSKYDCYYCSGFRIINGVKINCARRSGHGSQSLQDGLKNSCNCVFMSLIQKIGAKKFYEYLEKLGFTGALGIDFPGETAAVLMPLSTVTEPDLARMGFGQTIAISSLEMVTGFGAVINGGYVYQPHFVKNIYLETGQIVYTRPITTISKIFSDSTSSLMREMLFSVVDSGGGKNAKVEGYSIGGKTGTAQKYENGAIAQGKYIASFIGFAPYDDPEFVVYMVVDEPKGAYYGGVVAAPLAKEIFTKIFEFYDIKNETVEQKEKFKLPSFIGKTLSESAKICAELGLQYLVQGSGDYVTNQISAPDVLVQKNDIVLLIFE